MNAAGLRVLVTRPAAQSGPMERRLRSLGVEPLSLPMFEIVSSGNDDAHRARLWDMQHWDGWIFTSVNAARRTLELASHIPSWPPRYAIGHATAAVLTGTGRAPVQLPAQGNSSEDLLALQALRRVSGLRFLVCTGEGGRDAIAPELRTRGAHVERLDLYRRVAVEHPASAVRDVAERCDAVICTSGEGLARLHSLLPDDLRSQLTRRLLVVPSQRVLELARHLGFTEVRAPVKTSDEALVECLLHPDSPSP